MLNRPVFSHCLWPAWARPALAACLLSVSGAQAMTAYYVGNSLTDNIDYAGVAAMMEAEDIDFSWGRHVRPGAPLVVRGSAVTGLREGRSRGISMRVDNRGIVHVRGAGGERLCMSVFSVRGDLCCTVPIEAGGSVQPPPVLAPGRYVSQLRDAHEKVVAISVLLQSSARGR